MTFRRRWNTRQQYENRLRPSDFLQTAERAGLQVKRSWAKPRPDMLAQLTQMKIAPEFRSYSPAELATSSLTFVKLRVAKSQEEALGWKCRRSATR